MRHRKIAQASIIAAAVALGGCATGPITAFDTGGSKADGTVVMAARVGPFQSPEAVDWRAAESVARHRCAAWGYGNASAFSGISQRCLDSDCMNRELSRTFQCLD